MFRARYVMMVALLTLIAIGTLFGQARDFEPPTPEERLKELTGYRPSVANEEFRVYQPRRFRNPLMDDEISENEGFLGRSPYVAYEMEEGDLGFWQDQDSRLQIELPGYVGRNLYYEPVLNLTQYSVNFEFETPRYLTVPQPDGSARNYWYMLFTASNYDPYPKDVSLDFKIKTMAQDIYPEPEMAEPYRDQLDEQLLAQFARYSFYGPEITSEQVQQMNEMLLARFSGRSADELERMPQGERDRILTRIRSEMLRGIHRSLAINYMNYPDRMLLDRIADREARWRRDDMDRRYNPLVPAHHLMLRRKLMPRDEASHIGYSYPDIILEDVVSGNSYIITPIYGGPGVDTRFEVTFCPSDGSAPSTDPFDSLADMEAAELGAGGMIRLQPEIAYDPMEGMVEYIEVPFVHAVRRYWPRYRIGDRVDQYGFQLPPGHPDYERGIHIRSFHTMKKLHGAEYVELNIQGGRVSEDLDGMESAFEGMNVESGELSVPEEGLPQINGKSLIAAPVAQMVPILNSCYHWQGDMEGIWTRIRDDVDFVIERVNHGDGTDSDIIEPRIRSVVSMLLRIYAGDDPELSREDIPDVVIFDIENYVLYHSRVAFLEADGEQARILGNEHELSFVWNAQFFPVVCRVKHPTPRRYAPGDHVLLNYSLPTEPHWTMPEQLEWGQYLYKDIGEEEAIHSYTVSGVILDPHEYWPEPENRNSLEARMRGMERSAPSLNRYGAPPPTRNATIEDIYSDYVVTVSKDLEPYFDVGRDDRTDGWDRGDPNLGRPVKRVDSFGRTMQAGFRPYRVGDRVTPMEWEAYGSLLPVNLLRDWAQTGGYNPQREYLRSGDLLVGQPRLVLAEFRYEVERMPSGELALWPIGHQLEGEQEIYVDDRGRYWRHGFSVDAAGDYDAIIYEELGPLGRDRFDELLENTRREPEMRETSTRADRSFLKLVPEMDRYGVAIDFVHPITREKIPQRQQVLPPGDQIGEVLRDDAGNTVFAKAYKKLPRYLYEYEYEAISSTEAGEVEPDEFDGEMFDREGFRNAVSGPNRQPLSERDIERFWSSPRPITGSMDHLIGVPKVTAVPTLAPAKINSNFEADEYILIDRQHVERLVPAMSPRDVDMLGEEELLTVDPLHRYDRIYMKDLALVHRAIRIEDDDDFDRDRDRDDDLDSRFEYIRDTSIRGRNAVLYGTIDDEEPMPNHILFQVKREVIPTVAEGVAIFGDLDRQWDFMNVYVYGIRGPYRRSGLETMSDSVPGAIGRDTVTRYDHAPRIERDNWVLQLRFERLGSPMTRESQSVRFIRRYWYRDLMDTDPDELVSPVRTR